MMTPRTFQLPADTLGRTITFEGELLGSGSSQHKRSPRWTELHIYKTTSGKYVIHKIGRSSVVHGPRCGRDDLPRVGYSPKNHVIDGCLGAVQLNEGDLVFAEKDYFFAMVADHVGGLIEGSMTAHGNGVRRLTIVAEDALTTAAEKDPSIDAAFRNWTVA